MIAGKPPYDTHFLDVRIRNPLPGPIWLLYDLHHSLPRSAPRSSHSWYLPTDAAR